MATAQLRILVIDENRLRGSVIEDGLREAGHTDVKVVDQIKGIARQVAEFAPDVIFIDLENPNRDMLENMFQLTRAAKRPIAMFVDRADKESIERAVAAGVSAYVVDGLKKDRVKPILDMAISRFNAFDGMRREIEEAKNELENRRIIERAKGILMNARNISEEEAYVTLRKTAMNRNRKMVDIAQALIIAVSMLSPGSER